MRDISEEMSMQIFAGVRKMGKLNSGDRQGMKRNHPGETQRFSCKQEIGSLPCPHPNLQRHRAEDLLGGAIRKENQTLLGAELLKRGQREFPRHRQLEPRNSHLSRLVLLSRAPLSTDHVVIAAPGSEIQGRSVWDNPGARGVQRSREKQNMGPGPGALIPGLALVSPLHHRLRLSQLGFSQKLTQNYLCLLSTRGTVGLWFHPHSCLSCGLSLELRLSNIMKVKSCGARP